MANRRGRAVADTSTEEESDTGATDQPDTAPSISNLVRVTVNLTQRAHQDLMTLTSETGLSKTDVINRSLQVYALVEELLNKNGGALTVVHKDGTNERIYIL
ncbi:hypothetical protein [Catenuloplanes japonicus]|uniref:hypothetical protein n=1 Tax=Catenuloplanes japonicus TaxID=33876 RepID=UPI000527D1AE|nr:hypothetical protein [Catenuloplanes japonicus]